MEKFTLNEIKIAVINKDLKKLEELSRMTPAFSSESEAKELIYFINEATKILEEEKRKLSLEMKEIKKLKNFYNQNSSCAFDYQG
ncbi:hypothetical protein [Caminibacter pacificus]